MDNIFQYTGMVSFELSNQCNKVCKSPRCPLTFYGKVGGEGKVIMSNDVFIETLLDILQYTPHYSGFIGYSIYNEPTIDPRLTSFIKLTIDILPSARPMVITNGSYLNQTMINELYAAGLNTLWISCYTPEILAEFQAYKYPEGLTVNIVNGMPLQVISDTYSRPYLDSKKPCNSPLGHITIRCNGDVHLCCRDYESRYVFGNLSQNTLSEIIQQGRMSAIHADLVKGNRILDICRRCNTSF